MPADIVSMSNSPVYLRHQLQEKTKELELLIEKGDDYVRDQEQYENDMANALAKLRDDLTASDTQLGNTQSVLASTRDTLTATETTLETTKTRLANTETTLITTKNQLEATKATLADSTADKQKLQTALEKAQASIDQLKATLKSDKEAAGKTTAALNVANSSLATANSNLKTEIGRKQGWRAGFYLLAGLFSAGLTALVALYEHGSIIFQ